MRAGLQGREFVPARAVGGSAERPDGAGGHPFNWRAEPLPELLLASSVHKTGGQAPSAALSLCPPQAPLPGCAKLLPACVGVSSSGRPYLTTPVSHHFAVLPQADLSNPEFTFKSDTRILLKNPKIWHGELLLEWNVGMPPWGVRGSSGHVVTAPSPPYCFHAHMWPPCSTFSLLGPQALELGTSPPAFA